MTGLVIALALVAAFFYALSDFLQQRAASRASSAPQPAGSASPAPHRPRVRELRLEQLREARRGVVALFGRLLHDRVWFAGWSSGTLAYLVQALALHFGQVSTVQALQVTSLLFTLPLSTLHRPQRVRARDWAGAGGICLGLLLFFLVRGQARGAGAADRPALFLLLVLLGVAVVVLVLLALVRTGPVRAVLLATAAGASFASSASMVKLTTQDLATVGVAGTAVDWPGYSLALLAGTGTVLQQVAFASGKLPTASTAMIVANPVIGTIFSIVVYHEALPSGALGLTGLALGGLLVVAGVWVLSHSPLVR